MDKQQMRERRKKRIRKSITGTTERPRLSVFRSARHMYAQIIDDTTAKTIVAASTLSEKVKGAKKADAAKQVGLAIANACKNKGITQVVFDRNGFLYHGRVKALADGAREAGLEF
jgi:large subunit ribosomal protein L18